MPIKLIVPVCRSLMEGRGEWKFVSTLLLADGIGTVVAGGMGAWLGGLLTIAAVISGYNLVFGLIFCGCVTKRIDGLLRDMFVPMLSTFAFGSLALIFTAVLLQVASINNNNLWQVLGLISIYSVIYVSLIVCFVKSSAMEFVSLVRQQVSSWGLAKRAI
jgi:hypothetical protein